MRVDFNVPLNDGDVINNFRIRAALPTIRYCISRNASVVLMSHLGRPNGEVVPQLSLEHVISELEHLIGKYINFSEDCISDESVTLSESLKPGEIHLLENLRFHKGETANDDDFSRALSRHGDIYVNDAFGTAHRAHASNVGVLKYMKSAAAGILLEKERKYLSEAIKNPEKPFTVVLGGSKVKGKIELIGNLLKYADHILIGGAMAFTFLKARGKNIGGSLVDSENLKTAENLLKQAERKGVSIHLPDDVLATPELSDAAPWRVILLEELEDDEMGVDIGPETCIRFQQILSSSNTILWNGPLGVYEISVFSTGTQSVATMIRERTEDGAKTIIGGGDTAAAIEKLNMQTGFTHVSTGGGASLELLSGNYLPAFKALDKYDKK